LNCQQNPSQICYIPQIASNDVAAMPVARRVPAFVCLVLLSCGLSGCGSISSFMAGGMADLIPAWAGGLPADAPPRPGSPEYEAYAKRHEQQQSGAMTGPDPATSPSAEAVR
jgi:hypothetical protein